MASLRSPGISKVIFFFTSCFTGSMTLTVPPISDETHTSEASRLNSAKRGRASTSTLATIRRVAVSMKCAILVVSDVATRILPSGLRPMPSGSTPTWTSPSRVRFSTSMMVTVLSFSRSEEHTSELQSRSDLVCRLLLEKKKKYNNRKKNKKKKKKKEKKV